MAIGCERLGAKIAKELAMPSFCWIVVLLLGLGCQGGQRTEDSRPAATLEGPRIAAVPEVASMMETESASVAPGVLVEEVPKGSAPGNADIRSGDILFTWKRFPNPPANPEPAEGFLRSPFDWHDLRLEQSPRGVVEISGQREGVEKVWTVEPGSWRDVEVWPRWIGDYLKLYQQGQQQIEEGHLEVGTMGWQELVDRLAHEDEELQKLWVQSELARSWLEADVDESLAAKNFERILSLWKLPTFHRPESAYIYRELGVLFENRRDLERAHDFYSMSLQILQQLDSQSLTLAYGLYDLGRVAFHRRNLDQAQEFFNRALRIRKRSHPGVLTWQLA